MLNWLDYNLWVISTILFGFSMYSFYRGYKQWKSGSQWSDESTGKVHTSSERVPFFSIGAVWFGIILLAAAIGSFVWIQLEK